MTTDITFHTYQRGENWYVYWEIDGKRYSRSLKTKKQRDIPKALARLEAEIIDSESSKLTLEQYAKDFFIPGCKWIMRRAAMGHAIKEPTREHYRRNLVQFILPAHGQRQMTSLDAATIEDMAVRLPVSNSYRNEIMRTYRIILDEATRDRKIPPLGKVERFSRNSLPKDILTDNDLAKLFPEDAELFRAIWTADYRYEPSKAYLMWGALYMLMVSTGMRSGEARALELDHIYLDKQSIAIVQAFDTTDTVGYLKAGGPHDTRARVAPIPERTAKALTAWLMHRKGETPYVFEFLGRNIRRELIADRFNLGLHKAGIADGRQLTPHSLRYTYNTRMETKLPGEVLRSIIGHRSEEMTQHYSRPVIEERIKAMDGHRGAIEGFWG